MRFLIISLLAICLFSCKTYEARTGLIPNSAGEKTFTNRYFSDPSKDYVYKAQIDAYGKSFGGIIIMKKVSDSSHRVVLATDFGNKLIDFEIFEKTHQFNFVVEQLNRKVILNTLVDDFRILLSGYTGKQEFKTESGAVYKVNSGKIHLYYFQNNATKLLDKIVSASKTKEKVTFFFESKSPTFVENVSIEHSNIKLKIKLNQITD